MKEKPLWRVTLGYHVTNNWAAWALLIAAIITPIAATVEGNLGKMVTWVPLLTLLVYIIFVFYMEYPKEKLLQIRKPLPLIFQIDVERNEAIEALSRSKKSITLKTNFKDFGLLERRYNFCLDDLIFHTEGELDKDETRWEAYMMRAYWTTRTVCSHLPGEKTCHIVLPMRNVTALLGVGALFRTDWPVVLYQPFTDGYQPVIDLGNNARRVLESPDEKVKLYFKSEELVPELKTKDVAIALDFAGHSPVNDVANYLKQRQLNFRQINLVNTYQGNLTKEDQWLVIVQQLWQRLKLLRDEGVSRFHLFPAMPAALIFGLGMVMGRDVPTTVYQWFPGSQEGYYPVYKLENLKRYI
jgi:hypothetical protein